MNVGRFHDLKKFVGGIILQATNGGRGIEEGEALLLTERHNLVNLEAFCFEVHEMILIAKEYLSLDAPMVVDEVGVVEVHAPPLALWWETTQEQHLRILRQKGFKRMILYTILVAGDILCVQIRIHIRGQRYE